VIVKRLWARSPNARATHNWMDTPAEPARNHDCEGAHYSAYLITFVRYGAWLPGQAGSVDRAHNQFGTPPPQGNTVEADNARRRMRQTPYVLDSKRRQIVLGAMRHVCLHRGWALLAAHVRTNHVHVVLEANQPAEHVMNVLKSYASRALNQRLVDPTDRRRWARHGSTRHLWTRDVLSAAVQYVVSEQDEPMAVWEAVG
jgi:REP element-mobilizing transposase RayT